MQTREKTEKVASSLKEFVIEVSNAVDFASDFLEIPVQEALV